MLINEVEHVVGLSKKSIRLYEENGLLRPKRNSTNDYRIYDDEDIELLKKIKFLRELGVPIREIKMLQSKELSINRCLEDRIEKIEREQKNFETIKKICYEISLNDNTFENFNISRQLESINILRKEGFTMRETKTNKSKKIIGAILSSILFGFMFVVIIVTVSYFQFTEAEKIPWLIYAFIMFILAIPLIGMIVNLIERIKEILEGEEDEASKY